MGLQLSHSVYPEAPQESALYGKLRRELGKIFHELARQKESQIVEGQLRADHVHMCISIPPKYAVASVVGYLKGKSAITVARNFLNRKRNFSGEHFWVRGYFVSTVGRDEAVVREYIRNQEKEDERLEQLTLGLEKVTPFRGFLNRPL